MICPVEIARDMSAFRAARVEDHDRNVLLHEGRDGEILEDMLRYLFGAD
jgi:hypothetical protein